MPPCLAGVLISAPEIAGAMISSSHVYWSLCTNPFLSGPSCWCHPCPPSFGFVLKHSMAHLIPEGKQGGKSHPTVTMTHFKMADGLHALCPGRIHFFPELAPEPGTSASPTQLMSSPWTPLWSWTRLPRCWSWIWECEMISPGPHDSEARNLREPCLLPDRLAIWE